MKIIVTGANSFIGSSLCKGLLDDGYEVFALINKNTDRIKPLISHNRFHLLKNLDELEKIDDAFAIYHLAWFGTNRAERSDKKIQDLSIEMSKRVFGIAIKRKIKRFIFAGSQAEIGTRSEYGRAKAEFAKYAKEFLHNNKSSMEFYHLQIFSVYGIGDHSGTLIDLVINAAKNDEEIELSNASQKWNFICIDDAVNLLKMFIDEESFKKLPIKDTYHIGSLDTRPLKDYILDMACVNERYDKKKLLFGMRESNIEGAFDLIPDVSWVGDYKFKNFLDEIKRL